MGISWHSTKANLRMKSLTSKCKDVATISNPQQLSTTDHSTGTLGEYHSPQEHPVLGTAESRGWAGVSS